MTVDDSSGAIGAGRPTAAAGGTPPSGDTLPTSEPLSRLSTDFGLGGRDARVDAADPLAGRDLGGVVIDRLIAQGGMGRVYTALQRSPARTVAVKVMRPSRRSPTAEARFRREADLLGRLRHPGIAQVFLAGSCMIEGEETPYFVMEYVPAAETLLRACDRRGLDPRRRLEMFLEVCRAVGHGHSAGVVHRDLKPGNILVDGDGRPKVIDFGIARLADEQDGGFTETGEFVGTRRYSSPEQCDGALIDARSDVYSLGVVLHELLTGELPYDPTDGSLAATARVIRERPPARLRIGDRSLAAGADAIAARCLAKRPGDRYPTADDLADDVRRLLAGEPIIARRRGSLTAAAGWLRRRRTLAASGLAAGVTVMAVVVGLGPRWWPPAPASVAWRMPPYREIAFNLLDDGWRRHVVSMTDVECVTERHAGTATFIRPTIANREGTIVLRFTAPFELRAATLTAALNVWTTGDPFPYDPRARAALDVSADGVAWTNLETREANRGGSSRGPFDIARVVAGSREVWVRARLTGERSWPGDGLIYAQFLRSVSDDRDSPFRLTMTGVDPAGGRPPADTPAADG